MTWSPVGFPGLPFEEGGVYKASGHAWPTCSWPAVL
jgi:hypothetical protein